MPRKVAVYTRISRDDEGEGLGVNRQREDCERLVDLRGWTIAKIYEDNDLSAFKRNVRRPDFELMLSDLSDGLIDGIVAYDLDRLARQPRDLERLIDLYDDRKRLVFSTVTNDVNLATADGRTMARVMVAFANKSSHDTSRRLKRKHLELAQQGKSNGGPAPYGWQKDGKKVDPEAKKHIREAQKQILAGVRIGTIRTRWQAEGTGNPRQGTKRMAHHHVEHILTNPRLCGFRTYHGEILHDDEGQPVIGDWETINTVEELEAVCAAVAERKRNPSRGQPLARKYLLSGIARCGLCHAKIRGQPNRKWKPGSKASKYSYQCSVVNGGCGKVGRVGEPVEDLIIDLVLEEQRKTAAANATPHEARWPKEAELEAVEADITELTRAAKDRQITVSSLLQVLPDLERQRDELKLERGRFYRELKRVESVHSDIRTREEFRALPTIEEQQAILLHSLLAVAVHPAGRGARKFDPDLIEPLWRPTNQ
ncbi:recombinase family protein [Streptomyces sioyaensis]|uniref:recombinase family protein n=1 Tax=Streptomyces sioyaensis TaxID=67364 RepID=UPI00378F33CB